MAQKNMKIHDAAGLNDENYEMGYTDFAGNDNKKERAEILIGNGVRMDIEAFLQLLGFTKGKDGIMRIDATDNEVVVDGRDENGNLRVVERRPKTRDQESKDSKDER